MIAGGGLHATLKVPGGNPAVASTFEVVVPPGFDVGAHVHRTGQELFYVLEGELDLLAFEPKTRTQGDWHEWVSPSGQRFLHGGPGSVVFIPSGCPHAFSNPTSAPARVLFQAGPQATKTTSTSWQPCCARLRAGPTPRRSSSCAGDTTSSS